MRPLIYILDDDEVFAQLLKANLGRAGEFQIELFTSPMKCLEVLAEAPPHVLLTDVYMEEMGGVEVTREVRKAYPHLAIFVLTASGGVETAIDAMKAGANDYLPKPVNVTELTASIRNALKVQPLLHEAVTHRESSRARYSVDAILGSDPLVEQSREFIRRVGPARRVSVLLLGESGVGKNLAAHAIHLADTEARGPFVELNCAALPAELIEAELFGYMKGAFTGAAESKRGLVEVADGGTLFLDEIGEMPRQLQAKLLNFLEGHRFRRVGGTREQKVDLRIVTATNRKMPELLEGGRFRQDLFYRISSATHEMPPLRMIAGDIPLLARHFGAEFAREQGKTFESLTDAAAEVLKNWSWPGNVRELRNVMERAVLFASGPVLGVAELPPFLTAEAGGEVRDPGGTPADVAAIPLGRTLKEAEREYIRSTMSFCEGSVQQAADLLGISRKNLWEKRKRYGDL